MRFLTTVLLSIVYCLLSIAYSQDSLSFFAPSNEFNKKRFAAAVSVQAIGYGGSLALLSTAWYKDYPHSGFHSFDDTPEWLQMDKAGHFITSWYLGRMGSNMYEWSGVKKKKAVLYGALSGWGYLTAIEMMDSFSVGWGFSWSDFGANTLGTGLIIGQKLLPRYYDSMPRLLSGFSRMSIKFSFHQTVFPSYRSELLGKNISEQIIKDYNGQTYWLSFNISSFLWSEGGKRINESRFPKWLNIAFGYGGERMITGRDNEFVTLEDGSTIWMERHRQYYFSLDIDLSRIKTKSHFIKTLAETFCFIKIPAPALEFNKFGMKFHPLYY